MAVSAPEVMYGAYYPYLYGRGARSFHPAPPFQYEQYVSSGSSGAHSPASPRAPRHAKEEDERASAASDDDEPHGAARARAHYVSANCVVFTHYAGDVAAVVDDHFARALAQDKHKESVPMVSRNLPASFFNAAACGAGAGGAGGAGGVELYEYDPWHGHYGGYGAHRHAAEYHAAAAASHHSMAAAAGYGGLLLGRSHLHAQYKPVDWPHAHAHAHAHAQHVPAHLDPAACAPYSYPAVPGLVQDTQVQDSSKDLYWF